MCEAAGLALRFAEQVSAAANASDRAAECLRDAAKTAQAWAAAHTGHAVCEACAVLARADAAVVAAAVAFLPKAAPELAPAAPAPKEAASSQFADGAGRPSAPAVATCPPAVAPVLPSAVLPLATSAAAVCAAPWAAKVAAARPSVDSVQFPPLSSAVPRKVRFNSAEPASRRTVCKESSGALENALPHEARTSSCEMRDPEPVERDTPAENLEFASPDARQGQQRDHSPDARQGQQRDRLVASDAQLDIPLPQNDPPAANLQLGADRAPAKDPFAVSPSLPVSDIEMRDVVLDLLQSQARRLVSRSHAVYTVHRDGDGFQALLTVARWVGGGEYAGAVCDTDHAAVQSCAEIAADCIRAKQAARRAVAAKDAVAQRAQPPQSERPWAAQRARPSQPAESAQRGRRSNSRGPSSLQRKPDDDLTQETGLQPPYLVATPGHIAGYKVHIGDLPAQPFAELRRWLRGALGHALCPDPVDYGPAMSLSEYGRGQMIVTFASSSDAKLACRALDAQRFDGRRSNARFWVPKGYDARVSDPRFLRRGRRA